jgi:purine nucleosidase
MGELPDHVRYWGEIEVAPKPSAGAAALELLEASIHAGATIVGIGPSTNLALLDAARPGLLAHARVVLMGGWITPPRPGLPPWGPDMDWNVQCDTDAAETVFRTAGDLTLVTLPTTLDAHLRRRDMDRLRASGTIGQLLARQAEAHGEQGEMEALGRTHDDLPDDLLNFQYDVVACAVALGLPIAALEERRLVPRRDGDVLRFEERADGRTVTVAVGVDGGRLTAYDHRSSRTRSFALHRISRVAAAG